MPARPLLTALFSAAGLAVAGPAPHACAGTWPGADAGQLPAAVSAALQQAQVPPEALAAVVQAVDDGPVRLAWNGSAAMNPASVFKLFTTYAALDLLGPAWTWQTPVWVDGPVRQGVLDGSVTVQGSGDPSLVEERVWLLLQRLQQAGVRDIRGDIVLDNSAFAPSPTAPGDFDGDAMQPYNVQPDALLLNFKSQTFQFRPDPANGVAWVAADPSLSGVQVDASVALASGPCTDWRGALKAQTDDPSRVHFDGRYPAACGEQAWPMASADPAHYNARLIEALWRQMGGQLAGRVRAGRAPVGLPPSFTWTSPPLADVVRDINKYSNNVMAEQVFLSLARTTSAAEGDEIDAPAAPPAQLPVSQQDARRRLMRWIAGRWGEADASRTVIDNGAGLSRQTRVSAQLLDRLLQSAWRSNVMPELVSSLPVSAVDGTLRRAKLPPGVAHLKTGSLRDVAALAGYVLGDSGRRYVLVALINHPRAAAARPALDALVRWTRDDADPALRQNR
jgi:D-alanyl-D-alanine carboxypeptidase/D-alanyl-D-alanine-endopeptidase (penicillin-binding protein 4)